MLSRPTSHARCTWQNRPKPGVTASEDWPLGLTSEHYDVALVNITVTEPRKAKFDFASYRADSLVFSVKSTSDIQSISKPAGVAGLRVIVVSGTNQERILLG